MEYLESVKSTIETEIHQFNLENTFTGWIETNQKQQNNIKIFVGDGERLCKDDRILVQDSWRKQK